MEAISADEIPASALELLTKDWQDVARHAKGMQLAINRFTNNMELAVNEGHDSRSVVAHDVAVCGDQLNSVGDQTLAFAENIEKGVEPLAIALVSEPSDEGAVLVTNTLGTAQASAIRALGSAVLDIAEGNSSRPERSSATASSQFETAEVLFTAPDDLDIATSLFTSANDAPALPMGLPISSPGGLSDPVVFLAVGDDAKRPQTASKMKEQGQSPSAPIDVDLL